MMELRVGRPQKPFTVEVRRGRKGAPSSPVPALAPKPSKKREPVAKAAVEHEHQPVAAPPPPPRRILAAIEQPPAPPPVLVEPQIAKPRRGRPPKSEIAVAPRKPGRPRRDPPRQIFIEPEAAAAPVGPPPVSLAAPRETNIVHLVAQGSADRVPSKHGHISHVDRAEAATCLPRGERWKRRVPKVLW
jgi:hypothetical protein